MPITAVPEYVLGLDNIWKRAGHDTLTPPPTSSPGYTRPSADSTHRLWEAVRVGTEDLQHTLARLTGSGQILVLPADTDAVTPPALGNFKYGGRDAVRSNGTTGVAASLPVAIGLMGAGPTLTTITQTPNINTFTQAQVETSGTNNLFMVNFAHADNGEFAGFTLLGTVQGNGGTTSPYYNGMYLYNGSTVNVHDIYFLGCGPGYASAPPGETFMLDTNQFDNITMTDVLFDGRQANATSSASNIGFNSGNNATITRVKSIYAGYGTTFAHYQMTGLWNIVDCETGHSHSPQLNFERQGGSNQGTGQIVNIVRHKFDSTVSTTHIAIGNDQGWATYNIYDPDLSNVPTGKVNIRIYNTYAGNPTVQKTTAHGLGSAINCWVGGVWDPVTSTYSGGTLRNDLLNVTT